LTYFEAVGALKGLNDIDTHINDTSDKKKQLLTKVDDNMIILFEKVSGFKIPKSIS